MSQRKGRKLSSAKMVDVNLLVCVSLECIKTGLSCVCVFVSKCEPIHLHFASNTIHNVHNVYEAINTFSIIWANALCSLFPLSTTNIYVTNLNVYWRHTWNYWQCACMHPIMCPAITIITPSQSRTNILLLRKRKRRRRHFYRINIRYSITHCISGHLDRLHHCLSTVFAIFIISNALHWSMHYV